MTFQVGGTLLGIPAADWLGLLLSWTLKGSLLLIIGLVLQRSLVRQSAALRSLVWLLVFAAVLTVPLVQGLLQPPGSLQGQQTGSLPEIFRFTVVASDGAPDQPRESRPAAVTVGSGEVLPLPAPTGHLESDAGISGSLDEAQNRGTWLVLAAWLAGCGICGARLLRDLGSGWLNLRAAQPLADPQLGAEIAQVSRDLDLPHPPEVRLHRAGAVPFVIGWRRPVLILPTQALTWEPTVRRATLVHELAHIKRRDLATSLLIHLACMMLWFQPLVWRCAGRALLEMEKACDDWVLRQGIPVRTYAFHLLRTATRLGRSRRRLVGARALAERSPLSERMTMLLDRKIRREPVRQANGFLTSLAILAICCSVAALPVVAQDTLAPDSVVQASPTPDPPVPGDPQPAEVPQPQVSAGEWSLRVDPESRHEIQALLSELRAAATSDQPDQARQTELARSFVALLSDQLRKEYRHIDIYQDTADSQFVLVKVAVDRVGLEANEDVKIVLRVTPDGEDSFTILMPAESEPKDE